MQQLCLALRLPVSQTFGNFIPGRNAEVLAALSDWVLGAGSPYLALHGESGCGKTHLLCAACAALSDVGRSVFQVSLRRAGLTPDVCDGLDELHAVVLDDVQAVVANAHWERALFALFNRLRDRGGQLLVAARRPPAALGIELADLRSRLCSGPSFLVQPLDDQGLDQLLAAGARARGFPLDAASRRYLLSRCTRDPCALLGLLDRIDALSLAQGRAPTLPFLSAMLASEELH